MISWQKYCGWREHKVNIVEHLRGQGDSWFQDHDAAGPDRVLRVTKTGI